MPHTGGCQCGKFRYEMDVLEKSHVCHCRMCQRATGGLFAALVGAPPAQFRWIGTAPPEYRSSNLARRPFCPDCGTPLGFVYDHPGARQYVTIGSLDHPEAAPVTIQYGIESRLPFVEFCQGLPEERTGESPAASEFLAEMVSRQS